ncbi:MAG: LuxR family transcriptional regulator [Pseudomonadota bacterium]
MQLIEEFGEEIRQASTFTGLARLCIRQFAQLEVTKMSYHHCPPVGAFDHQPTVNVFAHGFPKEWVETYTQSNFIEIDPIPKRALDGSWPFWWSDLAKSPRLAVEEVAYFQAMNDAGLGDGLAISVFGPHARNGYVGLGFDKPKETFSQAQITRMHIMFNIAHQRYCELVRAILPEDVSLSEREKEILAWIAAGKSNGVIASILELSPNTVDTYTRRIFRKFDVADRVTAALRGASLGVFD